MVSSPLVIAHLYLIFNSHKNMIIWSLPKILIETKKFTSTNNIMEKFTPILYMHVCIYMIYLKRIRMETIIGALNIVDAITPPLSL